MPPRLVQACGAYVGRQASNRVNWLHERKVEAYIEIVEAIEATGEAVWDEARRRSFRDLYPGGATEGSTGADASEEDTRRSARLAALEKIYASSDLQSALSNWRYALTQIGEALSYPDADESDVEETRELLFGDVVGGLANGEVHLEQKLRAKVVAVVAKELGQRR